MPVDVACPAVPHRALGGRISATHAMHPDVGSISASGSQDGTEPHRMAWQLTGYAGLPYRALGEWRAALHGGDQPCKLKAAIAAAAARAKSS